TLAPRRRSIPLGRLVPLPTPPPDAFALVSVPCYLGGSHVRRQAPNRQRPHPAATAPAQAHRPHRQRTAPSGPAPQHHAATSGHGRPAPCGTHRRPPPPPPHTPRHPSHPPPPPPPS